MLAEIPLDQFAASLDAVASEVLAAAGIDRPPVDMLQLAARMGITLAWDARQQVRGRYVRLKTGGSAAAATILLRPEPRAERCQWAIAHEIGEHVACRVFAALAVDPREAGPAGREEVANHLAGRLLVPTVWLAADGVGCNWDLAELKARYSTASHELVARRMLDLPPPVVITIFDQARITFRRSNLPGQAPPISAVEWDCWRAVHERCGQHQSDDGPLDVKGWPVHEPGWKREILRTSVETEVF